MNYSERIFDMHILTQRFKNKFDLYSLNKYNPKKMNVNSNIFSNSFIVFRRKKKNFAIDFFTVVLKTQNYKQLCTRL